MLSWRLYLKTDTGNTRHVTAAMAPAVSDRSGSCDSSGSEGVTVVAHLIDKLHFRNTCVHFLSHVQPDVLQHVLHCLPHQPHI